MGGNARQIDQYFAVLSSYPAGLDYAEAEVFVAAVASSGNITGNPSRIG